MYQCTKLKNKACGHLVYVFMSTKLFYVTLHTCERCVQSNNIYVKYALELFYDVK